MGATVLGQISSARCLGARQRQATVFRSPNTSRILHAIQIIDSGEMEMLPRYLRVSSESLCRAMLLIRNPLRPFYYLIFAWVSRTSICDLELDISSYARPTKCEREPTPSQGIANKQAVLPSSKNKVTRNARPGIPVL